MSGVTSENKRTVETYLNGFRKNDHAQILNCLTDDDAAIEGPGFVPPPRLEVVRMVEEDDVVMAELTGTVMRETGEPMRMSMAEVFRMRDGKICERRAWVIELKRNEYV
jgi:ketosteroid isomerase-like protein